MNVFFIRPIYMYMVQFCCMQPSSQCAYNTKKVVGHVLKRYDNHGLKSVISMS